MQKAFLSGETSKSISVKQLQRQGCEASSVARLDLDVAGLTVNFVQSPDNRLAAIRPEKKPRKQVRSEKGDALLDPFSTSQTKWEKCIKNAPCICIPPGVHVGKISQACCNDWTCPRCGKMRARHEYGRMVEGARALAKDHKLYFLTITCPGIQTLEEAEAEYAENTNRFLTSYRTHVKRAGGFWSYAQVTERQPKRKHPHSHLLMTCAPTDSYFIIDNYERYVNDVKAVNEQIPLEMRYTAQKRSEVSMHDCFSSWLALACVKCGLGVQVRLSIVDSAEAVSRYIAKYLFKSTVGELWPKGWKRVRYSQTWPKLPEKAPTEAFPVLTFSDWARVSRLGATIETSDPHVYEKALRAGAFNVRCIVPNEIDLPPKPPPI